MYYSSFFRLKTLRDRLRAKIQQGQSQKDSPISVRDIFVYAKTRIHSFGESKNHTNKYQNFPLLSRLIDHIDSLASIANMYHEQYYCEKVSDDKYVIRSNSKNKITRVLLNEFSLYTRTPLNNKTFSTLVEAVREIASQRHENIHLLLSSFAYVTEDFKILNIVLYVECGPDPKIHVFSKGMPSDEDVVYCNAQNHSHQEILDEEDTNISRYVVLDEKMTISYNSVFPVTTLGGAEYTQAVDICLDNYFKRSKRLLKQQINSDKDKESTHISNQIDQILSSNTINNRESAKISDTIVHIDSDLCKKVPTTIADDFVHADEIKKAFKNKYQSCSVQKCTFGFEVENPGFGSDFLIVPQAERHLASYKGELRKKVEEHNKNVLENTIDTILSMSQCEYEEFNKITSESNQFALKIADLYKTLYRLCRPIFFEETLQPESYKMKLKIKALIESSESTFLLDKQNDVLYLEKIKTMLACLCKEFDRIESQTPSKFIEKLKTIIKESEAVLSSMSLSSLKMDPIINN